MKHVYLLLCLSMFVMALPSCKKSNNTKPANGKTLVLTATEQQKAAADNAFSIALFKMVAQSSDRAKNLFISPLSASMALGMTSNGASGTTRDSMYKTLHFDNFTTAGLNSYYHKLITELPTLDPNTTLAIANSIWHQQGFDFLPDFMQTNAEDFSAKIQSVNFSDPLSASVINTWVSQQTNGKIDKLIDENTDGVLMYLINAIYFKSEWKQKFDPANTAPQGFKLKDGSAVQTDFMSGNINCQVARNNQAIVLEMPYAADKFDAIMVVPQGDVKVDDLVKNLDVVKWNTWLSALQSANTYVAMPKFKFNYSIQLKDALSHLGMGIAFSDMADFSKMSVKSGLKISEVKQKAYVAVDEAGTEAAAATSVGIVATAFEGITVNKPFIFVIREKSTGLILFTGIVNNPLLSGD